jgi:hypothetical protein
MASNQRFAWGQMIAIIIKEKVALLKGRRLIFKPGVTSWAATEPDRPQPASMCSSRVPQVQPDCPPALFPQAEKLISFALPGECGRHFYGAIGEKICRIVINVS